MRRFPIYLFLLTAALFVSASATAQNTPVSIENALAALGSRLVLVYSYDAADSQDPWSIYDPHAPLFANDLQSLIPGAGYWVNVSEAASLDYGGHAYNFIPGWNLIAWQGTPRSEAGVEPPALGDWSIRNQQIVEGRTMTLNGNIIVKDQGSLTLRNATLSLNSEHGYQHAILVEPGGTLLIYDSIISPSTPAMGFSIIVNSPSSFVLKGSELRGLGLGGDDQQYGLRVVRADKAVIENNKILLVPASYSYLHGITLEESQHSTVNNNQVIPLQQQPDSLISTNPIWLLRSHNNTVQGNRISGFRDGISIRSSWNNRILDNTWVGLLRDAEAPEKYERWWLIDVEGWGGLELSWNSANNIVENNTFTASASAAIRVVQASNNRFSRNTVKGAGIGVALLYASDNILADNEFIDIWGIQGAVHAYRAFDNIIVNNRMSSVSDGVSLLSSGNNTVKANVMSDVERGFYFHNSDNNVAEGNSVTDGFMGTVLTNSSNNIIKRNNLGENLLRGYDDSGDNAWEENYWGQGIRGIYNIPPQGVDTRPSINPILILAVEVPELELLPYQEPRDERLTINDKTAWENQVITLEKGITIEQGGSLTLKNTTLIFAPNERATEVSLQIRPGGALLVHQSKIIAPEKGHAFRIDAWKGSVVTMRDSEIHNAGYWVGSQAAVGGGLDGATIENNTFVGTYSAISPEHASNVRITNNTVNGGVIGISIIGPYSGVVTEGNKIYKTAYRGLALGSAQYSIGNPVKNNTVSDSWGSGIIWGGFGFTLEGNYFQDIKGPAILLTNADDRQVRPLSLNSSTVRPGDAITLSLRIGNLHAVESGKFEVALKLNGKVLKRETVIVPLGEFRKMTLTSQADESGVYDLDINRI